MLTSTLLMCLLSLQAQPAQDKEVKLTPREKLADATLMPVVFSPDGKSVLYFKRTKKKFIYALADLNGKPVRDLFESPVDWKDLHNGVAAPYLFSGDGKRVAVLTTKEDKSFRTDHDSLRAAICDLEGKVTKIDADYDCISCAFAGDLLLFLDELLPTDRAEGYRLRAWNGEDARTVNSSNDEMAVVLRPSPDASRVAFYILDGKGRGKLRVVDLKSREAVDSELFPCQDVTFDGPPLFYWDAEGKGIFHHRTPDGGGKTPFSLAYFDLTKRKIETIFENQDVGAVAVLDKDYLGVMQMKRNRGGVLRLSDRAVFSLPEGQHVVGGAGRRLAVLDMKTGEIRLAEWEVPK